MLASGTIGAGNAPPPPLAHRPGSYDHRPGGGADLQPSTGGWSLDKRGYLDHVPRTLPVPTFGRVIWVPWNGCLGSPPPQMGRSCLKLQPGRRRRGMATRPLPPCTPGTAGRAAEEVGGTPPAGSAHRETRRRFTTETPPPSTFHVSRGVFCCETKKTMSFVSCDMSCHVMP